MGYRLTCRPTLAGADLSLRLTPPGATLDLACDPVATDHRRSADPDGGVTDHLRIDGPFETLDLHAEILIAAPGAATPPDALRAPVETLSRSTTGTVDPRALEPRAGPCVVRAEALRAALTDLAIPARLVTGVRIGDRDPHCWVEIQDAATGDWHGFDPSAAAWCDEAYLALTRGATLPALVSGSFWPTQARPALSFSISALPESWVPELRVPGSWATGRQTGACHGA